MPGKGLDVFDVGSAFKQMAGKTVAAYMGRNRAGNTGKPGAFLKELVHTGYIQVSASSGAWEKDTLRTAAFVPIPLRRSRFFWDRMVYLSIFPFVSRTWIVMLVWEMSS